MNEQLTLAKAMLLILVQTMVHLMAYCLASHLVTMMGTYSAQMMILQLVYPMAQCLACYIVQMTNDE